MSMNKIQYIALVRQSFPNHRTQQQVSIALCLQNTPQEYERFVHDYALTQQCLYLSPSHTRNQYYHSTTSLVLLNNHRSLTCFLLSLNFSPSPVLMVPSRLIK